MKIVWAEPCREARLREGTVDLDDAGFTTLWVPRLPYRVSFHVVARLRGLQEDFAEPVTVEAYLYGPRMAPIDDLTIELPATEPGIEHEPGWEMRIFHVIPLVFRAEEEGWHALELYVEGEPTPVHFAIRVGSPR